MPGPPRTQRLHTRYADVEPFVTKDGSTIRELMHPAHQAVRMQSLAEATVAPGGRTLLHRHRATEEIYHIVSGQGQLWLGETMLEVRRGDTVAIPAGIGHCIRNHGRRPLRFLCACSPAYAHRDTELLECPW